MLIEMLTQGEDDPTFAEQVLANEVKIVWVEDPLQYPYLREMCGMYLEAEEFHPGFGDLKLIGYAVVREPVMSLPESQLYRRRSWWIAENDPYSEEKLFPIEGVIPRFIRMGKATPLGRDCGGDRMIYREHRENGETAVMILHPDGLRTELVKS